MATSILSLDTKSIKKPVKPVSPTVECLADWQRCLAIWEAEIEEIEQDNLIQVSAERVSALLGVLCEMMRRLTRKAAYGLNADRASIFFLDASKKELVSILAEDGEGSSLVIEAPSDSSIAGLAATSKKVINIPFDVYDSPRSFEAKKVDRKTGYRTYSILAWPLLNEQKDLVAVVEFINKLKRIHNPVDSLSSRIDTNGFTNQDEAQFSRIAPAILQNIKRCQHCYHLIQKLRGEF